MALVEAEDAPGSVPLGKNHDRAIGEAEVEIGVAGVELSDDLIVASFQAGDVVGPSGEIGEKGTRAAWPKRTPSR